MTTIECRGTAQTAPDVATTSWEGGDVPKPTGEEKFWSKIDRSGGPDACWPWQLKLHQGYGHTFFDGRNVGAHRVAWILTNGPVPDGLHIDHQCHNLDASCAGGNLCAHRACCNPAHLDAATSLENTRRRYRDGNCMLEGFCRFGHPLSGDNLYIRPRGVRVCLACADAAQRRAYWLKRGEVGRDGMPQKRVFDEAAFGRVHVSMELRVARALRFSPF